VRHALIRSAFERFLKSRKLRLTPQRERIFERAFATHEHFSAETMYGWLRAEGGPRVSRATVYRTLSLLLEGEFMRSLDTGSGELVYEHTMGHQHHDHLLCEECGKIEEFYDEAIEERQRAVCDERGFVLRSHDLRLVGTCRACARKVKE